MFIFRFIGSIFHEMRMTTWPKRKQAWHDFAMVVEYTLFFMVFLLLFDWLLKNGLDRAINFLLPYTNKL